MEIVTVMGLVPPEDGLGLQQAVLEEVAKGSRGPTALLWTTSSRYVGATRPETRLPGFGEAMKIAEAAGFLVLVRNSGGGAVAANEGSISFSLTSPVENSRRDLYKRYAEGAELIVDTMHKVGVAAEPGEVEGEFCPGAYSVRVGGRSGIKVAGLAQRVTKRAARLEALVLVSHTAEIIPVLEGFYGALGLALRPESVGDLAGVDVDGVIRALSETVRRRYPGARETSLGEELFVRARALRERWRVEPGVSGPASICLVS